MRIAQIWQYPVKSMIGSTVPSAELVPLGIVGDRRWALRDTEAGFIANTRQTPGIMQLAAAHAPGGAVSITLPDGSRVASTDAAVNEVLSGALGRAILLEVLRPADDLDFYRSAPLPEGDPMPFIRDLFGRDDGEPIPDFAKFGPNVGVYSSPPGTFYDCYPLMIMTTSALRSMAAAVPDSVVDVRRFRPSLLIDTGDEPGHPEFGWTGRRFAIGDAVVEVINDCPRCAAITKQVTTDIPQDRAILRHVVRDLGQAVGMYATVVRSGTIHENDPLLPT